MKGTIFSVTLAIDLMPPTITRKTMVASSSPVIQPLPLRKLDSPPVMLTSCAWAWLAWNMLPPPKEPPMQKIEKTTAMIPPPPKPRSRKPLTM